MVISAEACIVALLGRDDGARRQLRQALEELGAAVAFEGDLVGASDSGVLAVGPNVVIVNLEEGADDVFDHLQAVFDDPTINVVFNEADVSRTLEGWDLARWARHLAAKVLGHGDTLPPPPQGAARFTPVPAATAVAAPEPAGSAPEAAASLDSDAVPGPVVEVVEDTSSAVQPDASGDAGAEPVHPADAPEANVRRESQEGDDDGAGPEPDAAPLEDTWQWAATSPEPLASTPEPMADDELDLAALEAVDFDAELTFEPGPPELLDAGGQEAGDAPVAAAAEDDFDWSFGGSDEPTGAVHTNMDGVDEDAAAEVIDVQPVAWSPDADTAVQDDDGSPLDADVAALAAQLDAFELDAAATDVVADLEFPEPAASPSAPAEAPEPSEPTASAPASEVAASASKGTGPVFGALSLAPLDEAAPIQAPATDSGFDFSSLTELSLEPLDDEDAGADPLLVAMGLADAPSLEQFNQAQGDDAAVAGGIERVVVLGASIGGPDALRSFLAELPLDFPAVVLIVQHLESGYFERLGQQLQKSAKVPVKLATANAAAVPGEALVIPASERVMLESDGRLVFQPHASPPQHTPSIDGVLRDVADRFGKRATAIIFSGMGGDGVEGAAYLTAKGGEVWAQDPASCVVSSMVDGARARGVVEFTGSPRELAARCVAQFMR